jgi:GTP-binding protein
MNNIVAIVDRTWEIDTFNRLIQRREAIVDSVSGYPWQKLRKSEWNGKEFSVIDTGGYIRGSDVFEGEIRKQVELAIDEADVIIFVVDVEEGITNGWCCKVIKVTKPVLLAVNKVDNAMREKDDWVL